MYRCVRIHTPYIRIWKKYLILRMYAELACASLWNDHTQHAHTMPWLVKDSYSIGVFAALSLISRGSHREIGLAVLFSPIHARGTARVLDESLLVLLLMQRFGNVSVSDF